MTSPRNASIDVLRAVAILLVLGHHFPYYHAWTQIGWTGVNLFFILSGFLVSGLLFDSFQHTGSVQARRFFIRRGFKIWPSFYIFLAAYALLAMLNTSRPYPLRAVLHAATFIQNYTNVNDGALTAHIWSLCVEEHFYLLLPALFLAAAYLLGSRAPQGIAIVAALSMPACLLLRLRVAHDGEGLSQSHLLFDTLFFGVLLSYTYRFHRQKFKWLSSVPFAILGAACLLPIFLGLHETRFVQTVGITSGSIGFGLLLCWAIDRWPANPFAASALKSVARIGFYSYPIYLWHVLVRFVASTLIRNGLIGFWVYIAASVFFGAMMAQNTEQPFLRLRDRLFPESAAATPLDKAENPSV